MVNPCVLQLKCSQIYAKGVTKSAPDQLSQILSDGTLVEKCCEQPTVEAQLLHKSAQVGHVLRMIDERLAKQLLYGKLVTGKLRRGRQFHALTVEL